MKLYHKDGGGCSWGGETFTPDADGAVDVPNEAIADLASHGFTTTAPAPAVVAESAPTPTGNPAKWTKEVLTAEAVRLGLDATQDRPALVKEVAAARKAEADEAYTEAEAV
jgi:hypothetical protein